MSDVADDRHDDAGDSSVADESVDLAPTRRGRSRGSVLRLVLLSFLTIAVTAGAWVGLSLGDRTDPGTNPALPQPAVDERWMDESITRDKDRQADEPVEPEEDETEDVDPEDLEAELDGGESSESEPVPTAAGCDDYSGNKQIGCNLLPEFGFDTSEMSCLAPLWDHESGWNENASNPSSGAYGIPQSLPGDKMASAGDDWRTNPATQIRWGLGYIGDRYGTPCGAWSHFQSNNWY